MCPQRRRSVVEIVCFVFSSLRGGGLSGHTGISSRTGKSGFFSVLKVFFFLCLHTGDGGCLQVVRPSGHRDLHETPSIATIQGHVFISEGKTGCCAVKEKENKWLSKLKGGRRCCQGRGEGHTGSWPLYPGGPDPASGLQVGSFDALLNTAQANHIQRLQHAYSQSKQREHDAGMEGWSCL